MDKLIQRIQQTVAAAPDNPAVRTWSTDGEPIVLNYSELWQQVQRVFSATGCAAGWAGDDQQSGLGCD